MINTHELNEEEYVQKGWVKVSEEWHYDEVKGKRFRRINFANPENTCLKSLRDGPCVMDKDHKGRCTTVAFGCDGCGKMRRGRPYKEALDVDGVPEVQFCFMCIKVESDDPYREYM